MIPFLKSSTRSGLTIFGIALAVRLLFFAGVHPWSLDEKQQLDLNNDSPGYHDLAVTLLDHGKFARGVDREPDALRTPGYPVFVAGVYAVAGTRPWVVMLLQVFLDSAACLVLYRALRQIAGDGAARWGAWLYALDLHLILYGCMLLSDTLFVFTLVVALWIATRIVNRGYRLIDIGLFGIVLGISTLVKPVAQYLPLFVLGWLFWTHREKMMRSLAYFGVFCAGFLVVLAPWMVRNQMMFDHFALSTSSAYNLLVLNVAPVEAAKRGLDFDTAEQQLKAEADSTAQGEGYDSRAMNAFQRAEYWKQTAVQYIRAEPVDYSVAYAKGVLFTFLNLGSSGLVQPLGVEPTSLRDVHGMGNKIIAFFTLKSVAEIIAALLAMFILLPSYVCGWHGFWIMRHELSPMLTLCIVIALYFALIVGVGGLARFRLPVLPFYLVFVGVGADAWWRYIRRKTTLR